MCLTLFSSWKNEINNDNVSRELVWFTQVHTCVCMYLSAGCDKCPLALGLSAKISAHAYCRNQGQTDDPFLSLNL